MKLGTNLLSLCKKRDLSIAKLSRMSGMPTQTLHGWTTGKAAAIGEGFMNFLNDIEHFDFKNEVMKKYCKLEIERCKSWLTSDSNGKIMIHFLGPEALRVAKNSQQLGASVFDLIPTIESFVQGSLVKHRNDAKILGYYQSLDEYIKRH